MASVAPGVVVFYLTRSDEFLRSHEGATLTAISDAIAHLKCYTFGGRWNESHRGARVFFVPDDTLVASHAHRLGIYSVYDLFGGIVPYAFVRTKAISHGLVSSSAARPSGWSKTFAARIHDVVLPGYTAFSSRDAETAASMLLAEGAVRTKRPLAAGGRGQSLVRNSKEVAAIVETVSADEFRESGLVFETNLSDVTTWSVGHVLLDDMAISYHGKQRMTTDVEGRPVYAGSDLVCVRGDWNALDRLSMTPQLRHAVAQAKAYDHAMNEYAGFEASRRNYDVGQGLDACGRWRSGVLEASWRVGGATPAEFAALTAFKEDATVDVVHASTIQQLGDKIEPPAGARVYFHGDDPHDPLCARNSRAAAHAMKDVRIAVDAQGIAGKLLTVETPAVLSPAVLFIHGWGGSQRRDIAKAKQLIQAGYTCLTFNLRGHARTRRQFETVTRAQNLRDALAAYDFLVAQPGVDLERMAVVGSSYGAYLGVLLTCERKVWGLALQAPAIYKDADFDRPKRELNLDARLHAFRRQRLSPGENRVLAAASRFAGDVLIVESEYDAIIPHQVVTNYLAAFAVSARSVTQSVLRGADHGLSLTASRRDHGKLLQDWFMRLA